MSFFGLSKKEPPLPWPRGEDGAPEPAALLTHTDARGLETEITVTMLRSYGIPAVTSLSGEGLIGELYTGAPSFGTDVFVPVSFLEDARALLEAPALDDAAENESIPEDDSLTAAVSVRAREEYEKWMSSPALTEEERRELRAVADDFSELESRFSEPLPFGTAGLRGVMALGVNRMNIHVVRHVTQAFAETLLEDDSASAGRDKIEVAVCRDCRVNSRLFSEETAAVLAGNGIRVRVFDDMRPTPELSFAVRYYGCAGGVNITASHNTREYNGYKVYLSDGAQLPPATSERIAERMNRLDIFDSVKRVDYAEALSRGMITVMGRETDEAFLSSVIAEVSKSDKAERRLSVVFTPFHGAGRLLVPEALSRLGFENVLSVEEQTAPDGNFPTVLSPNPETPESFALAVKKARVSDADIIIGTDPDCDRIAVLPRHGGEYVHLSGHKTGVLLLDYIAERRRGADDMPKNPVALKSIVTTDMARRAAEARGVRCIDTFTGFKFMAEMKNKLEAEGSGSVIFSYEESYGYMLGDYVRDKDAVTAAALISEMASSYLSRGMTLIDALDALYEKLGYYDEGAVSLIMPGADGARDMRRLMSSLRLHPPARISGARVVARRDYLTGEELRDGKKTTPPDGLSGSDVLRFDTEDGAAVLIRPSGTEPKIKVYILAQG
ncbi:MAG: phospho-sugar mutase, partial [Oscillospiraceae bacterium]|nr:phospho-sugar mutase [Oscillospiraceae bacterium]